MTAIAPRLTTAGETGGEPLDADAFQGVDGERPEPETAGADGADSMIGVAGRGDAGEEPRGDAPDGPLPQPGIASVV